MAALAKLLKLDLLTQMQTAERECRGGLVIEHIVRFQNKQMSLNPEQIEICHKMFALWEQFPDARLLIQELCETLPRPMFVYIEWLVLRWTHIRPSP